MPVGPSIKSGSGALATRYPNLSTIL